MSNQEGENIASLPCDHIKLFVFLAMIASVRMMHDPLKQSGPGPDSRSLGLVGYGINLQHFWGGNPTRNPLGAAIALDTWSEFPRVSASHRVHAVPIWFIDMFIDLLAIITVYSICL